MTKPLKRPLDYQALLSHLETEHNLCVGGRAAAEQIISSVGYYRLSAYGLSLHVPNTNRFPDGASLLRLYRIYQFDAHFRHLLLSIVDTLEVSLRAKIANRFATNYGAEAHKNKANFVQITNAFDEDLFDALQRRLEVEISKQRDMPFVKHHLTVYGGHFPVWVAIELYTIGMLRTQYSIMKQADKKAVARLFSTKPVFLETWIKSLANLRNICAHQGRLYFFPLRTSPKLYSEHAEHSNTTFVFHTVIMLACMLGESAEWYHFVNDLYLLIEDYQYDIDLRCIGFPPEWKGILLSAAKREKNPASR